MWDVIRLTGISFMEMWLLCHFYDASTSFNRAEVSLFRTDLAIQIAARMVTLLVGAKVNMLGRLLYVSRGS